MAEDELGSRREGKTRIVAAGTVPAPSKDLPDGTPLLHEWLMAQHLHSDPGCAAAARAIRERWDLNHTPVSRIDRALAQEDSEHSLGLRQLLDEYREIYGVNSGKGYLIRATGSAANLVPVGVEYCSKCKKREAIPGTGLCARDGGQWIDDETRVNIGRQVADQLLELSGRAVRTLADLMDNAGSEKVRLEAAIAVLDRAGNGAVININHSIGAEVSDQAAELVRQRLDRLNAQMSALPAALLDDEPVDAEVVG